MTAIFLFEKRVFVFISQNKVNLDSHIGNRLYTFEHSRGPQHKLSIKIESEKKVSSVFTQFKPVFSALENTPLEYTALVCLRVTKVGGSCWKYLKSRFTTSFEISTHILCYELE